MSWDVLLIKTETNGEPIEDISSPIPFDKEGFIKLVKANFPDTDCRDDTWLILNRERYSIEFNVGETPIQTIMLHIRGSEEPGEVISVLCDGLNCRALDTSSGEFIQAGRETAFQEWKKYRDGVIESMNQ